jgi:hypothetical protein
MTPQEFVIWLRGFTEACNDFTATPKQWDRLKEVLNEVEDYGEDNELDLEIDDFDFEPEAPLHNPSIQNPYYTGSPILCNPGSSGTTPIHTSGSTLITATTLWNDKHGYWHYTNSTLESPIPEEIKKQLID